MLISTRRAACPPHHSAIMPAVLQVVCSRTAVNHAQRYAAAHVGSQSCTLARPPPRRLLFKGIASTLVWRTGHEMQHSCACRCIATARKSPEECPWRIAWNHTQTHGDHVHEQTQPGAREPVQQRHKIRAWNRAPCQCASASMSCLLASLKTLARARAAAHRTARAPARGARAGPCPCCLLADPKP